MRPVIIVLLFVLASCGRSAVDNELVGQVKKVVERTPLVCPNYTEVDVSLGVLRNGVGSLSKEDVVLYVADKRHATLLKRAAETGQLVKATYDIQRVSWCRPDHWLTSASLVDDKPFPSVEQTPGK